MEDNRRYDDNDFFSQEADRNRQAEDDADKGEKQATYYSYGPYKPASEPERSSSSTTSMSESGVSANVEMTAPKPVRPFTSDIGQPPLAPPPAANSWDYKVKKRSVFKPVFAAFLVGAVVVGGLMFASDRLNLFTDRQAMAQTTPDASNGSGAANNASGTESSGGGSVKTASVNDVVRPNNIAEIVQKSSPAVVKIETLVKSNSRRSGSSLFDDPFFRQFFGDDQGTNQDQPQSDGKLQKAGMGSGFIFDKSGYILTNQHVIEGADEVQVTVEGYDKPFVAKVLGSSPELDLAALKIEGTKDFPTLKLGNVNDLSVGDWVVAIGNPYGFDHTVTVGVLSAKERPIDIQDGTSVRNYEHLLQTDASINPGNSGGPLLNLNGEVVGINTAVSTQAQGIGFAIPTTTIQDVLENLKNNVAIPKAAKPWIGIKPSDIKDSWVDELHLDSTDGVLVQGVYTNSPSDKAGLQTYDVIISIDGEKLKNSEELVKKIQSHQVGDKVKLTIVRDGKQLATTIILGDQNTYSQK